jgi:hypothetical protein
MKRLIGLSIVFSLLAVSNLLSYVITEKNSNEIKWRPLPASISYKMYQTEPNSACSTLLKNACKAWEDEGRSNVDFNYAGETSTNTVDDDGLNVVMFPRVCNIYAASETTWLAGTYWWYNTSTYALIEFDICVAQKFHWCYTDSPQGDTYDFLSTLTHEFGHTLGINDLYKYYDDAKTMYGYGYPAITKQRSLEQDDKDAVAYLYPTDSVDKVWIKTATDDYGVVKYPGDVFWQSPDISLKPDPPVIAEACSVFVTARNMRPDNLTGRIIIEVHDPDVSLRARTSVLYADTLIDKTIPSGNHDATGSNGWNYDYWANSKRDGETTYVFVWTPDSNTFDEDHYCMVATVESGSDTLRDLDVPDDNDIACHNFHTIKGGSGGSGQMMSFGAGNPTGVAVWRHLYLEPIYMPAGWMVTMPPFDDSMYLTPLDTFFPVPLIMTPPASPLNGEYGIVQVRCVLNYYSPPFQILMTGGIIYKLIVGEPGDVGATGIQSPSGTILPGTNITPRAVVKNFGATVQTFSVKFTIGDVYTDDSSNITLNPAETLAIDFNQWSAVIGSYAVSCSTELTNDWRTYNDKLSTTIEVAELQTGWIQKEPIIDPPDGKTIKDGGALVGIGDEYLYAFLGTKSNKFKMYTIGTKSGWTDSDSMIFGYKYKNGVVNYDKLNKKFVGKGAALCYDGVSKIYATKGNGTNEFFVYDTISDAGWTLLKYVPTPKALKIGTALAYLNGKVYLFAGGHKPTDPSNFYAYDIAESTWTAKAGMDFGPTFKPLKAGSCLAELNGVIYGLKGGAKANLFFAYDTGTNTWTQLESIPLPNTLFGKYKKKITVKDGGAMAAGDGVIYAIKGGGTNVFWKYTPISDVGWESLESIPVIDKKHAPKTGAAMAFIDGKIWLLVGNKQVDYWCYVPTAEKSKVKTQISNMNIQTENSQLTTQNSQLNVTPNPFAKLTTVRYNVPVSGKVSLKLYNATGRLIEVLNDKYLNAGVYTTTLSTKNLTKGIYFLRYSDNTNRKEIKLIVQ